MLDLGQQVPRRRHALGTHHEAMIAQDQDVGRVVGQGGGDHAGERQAGLAVGYPGPAQAGQPLGDALLAVLADRQGDRPHGMGVHDDAVRQQCVQRGLDRWPQPRGVQLGDHGGTHRVGGIGRDARQHRRQRDRHEDVALQRVGEPQARGLDPQGACVLERGVAAGRLDLLRIAAQLGREGREFRQPLRAHRAPRARRAAP